MFGQAVILVVVQDVVDGAVRMLLLDLATGARSSRGPYIAAWIALLAVNPVIPQDFWISRIRRFAVLHLFNLRLTSLMAPSKAIPTIALPCSAPGHGLLKSRTC